MMRRPRSWRRRNVCEEDPDACFTDLPVATFEASPCLFGRVHRITRSGLCRSREFEQARHVMDTQPEEARKAFAAVESVSRAALNELRQMLGILRRDAGGRPVLQPAPAISDLASLVEQVRAAGVPVELTIRGSETPLSSGLELSVYRIVQEALTNVVKHAGPAHASVAVTYGAEELVIEVVDSTMAWERRAWRP